MKLATIRTRDGATRAVRVDGDGMVDLGSPDVGTLPSDPAWPERASRSDDAAARWTATEVGWAPVLPRPGKIVRVGLNYRSHILEMGRELPGGVRPALRLTCRVDGELVQCAHTADLVFDPVDLVRYISTIVTLRPGDLIATGTPGGVGHARTPAVDLRNGRILETEIDGIGELRNVVRAT